MTRCLLLALAVVLNVSAAGPVDARDVHPGEGTRLWLGPDIWPNPMQDWSTQDGTIVAVAGQDRTAHALGHWISSEALAEPVEVRVAVNVSRGTTRAGLRVGVRSALMDHRAALFAHGVGIDAAIDEAGTLYLGERTVATRLQPFDGPVELRLELLAHDDGETRLRLRAIDHAGNDAELTLDVKTDTLIGNVALLAESAFKGPTKSATVAERPRVVFRDWSIQGRALQHDAQATLGPILWSHYTLSDGMLTVSAQMPALGTADAETVGFEISGVATDGAGETCMAWEEVARSAFDDDARVAVFRIDDWGHAQPIAARLTYAWQGRTHTWPMTIRPEPAEEAAVKVAVLSCDAGYAFPQTPLVEQVLREDPDLLFFAGDQIYEHVGGFGVGRDQPVDFAILDYLRKYSQFGWTWREVLRDRPSVIIPDDHDVFHGNVWGAGGRLLEADERFVDGGYRMPVRFVNAVQRTQTGHLPPPHDATPTDSGIGVYYTDLRFGPLDLAVLEDRKWKDSPSAATGPIYERASLEEVQLLGSRQLTFLADWVQRDAPFKVVLSQTMFAKPATHAGWKLEAKPRDPDSNGWPMPARDRALELLGPGVVMLSGDQHLGMLARLGISAWDDGPLALMAPGSANGHPRAWWPESTADGRPAEPLGYTGRYVEGLGNQLTVLGVANPEPGSHELRAGTTNPYTLARLRGSGFALAEFVPSSREIVFSLVRFPAEDADQREMFPGLPVTVTMPPIGD